VVENKAQVIQRLLQLHTSFSSLKVKSWVGVSPFRLPLLGLYAGKHFKIKLVKVPSKVGG